MGLSLRADQVRRLVARTEGWAAGLRLAGLTLTGEADAEAFVAGFAGDDRAVADYLTGEVLDGQPAATRDFLLRTSVAESLCGELAGAICGAPEGSLTLERLARAGMFLVALDRRRRWYRYHALFREHLRARLRLEQPAVERELHARAAAWLAANGHGVEAVAHALAAGDAGGCDELLAEQWVELLAGGWDAAVVAAASDRRPYDARLAVAAASALLERGDTAAACARLEAVHPPGAVERGSLAGRLGAEQHARDVASVAALLMARARGDLAAARAAFEGLCEPGRAVPPEALRAVAHLELGATEFAHGSPEAAAEQLEAAGALAAEVGAQWVLFASAGRSAALEAAAGRLARAEKAARSAIAAAERRGWHRSAAAAWAYAALAAVHWQRDELDDAERRCDSAAVAAHASADAQTLIAARVVRAQLAAAHGDVERTRGLLSAVEDELPAGGALLRRWIEALGPACCDSAGDGGPIAEAAAWMRRADPLAALRRVERLAEGDPPSRPAVRLHALVITAVARHSLGRPEEAARALDQALAIASAEGYRRPFLAGLPLRRLLERQLGRPTAYAPLAAELLDALQQRDEPPAGLLEPLSERERAVLRLLPTLLSYPEIGAELFVAANTVKTHVKSIYRKLDVGSRREAVARARALRLI
jgi:LuxR family transcriptional regulator, maltose regulon positive regulatory protein